MIRPVAQQSLTFQPRGQIYMPHAESAREHLGFVVRAGGDATLLAGLVRREVAAVDGELAVARGGWRCCWPRWASTGWSPRR